MSKLSQDNPDELWQRVHDGLAADPASVQVARDMAEARQVKLPVFFRAFFLADRLWRG